MDTIQRISEQITYICTCKIVDHEDWQNHPKIFEESTRSGGTFWNPGVMAVDAPTDRSEELNWLCPQPYLCTKDSKTCRTRQSLWHTGALYCQDGNQHFLGLCSSKMEPVAPS